MEKSIINKLVYENKPKEIPIWLMRQAGRYLPEYMNIRRNVKNFLELCYTPKLACEVTLQPVDRFNLDAAIIFSDILTIPDALGINVRFEENIGPIIAKTTQEDLKKIRANLVNLPTKLAPVYEAISLVREKLDKSKPLIGFSGAPWTLAAYILEGKGSRDFNIAKTIAYHNNEYIAELISILEEAVSIHLKLQIEAGANIIQIFDSWAGVLPEELFKKFVIIPTSSIVKSIKAEKKNIPIIGFPKGASLFYADYVKNTNVDIISLDSNMPRDYAKRELSQQCVLQGNLDPIYLLGTKDILAKEAEKILNSFYDKKFIFNLGHGVLPNTPVENVKFLVDLVKKWKM